MSAIRTDRFNITGCVMFSVQGTSGVPRGGLGYSAPLPKSRRYRWSPRSHEQEEPAS